MRALAATLLFAAPAAALAWPACDQAGIQPPVPLQRDAPAYPPAVRAIGIEGSVELALTVLRDGRVGWTQVLRADPPGYFEQAAADGVRHWRFEPARRDGEAIECRMRTRVRFSLVDTVAMPGASSDASGRPSPVYPAALLAARVEGYAEVEYEIDAEGGVANARVINAMPRGEFEAAALDAVRAWRPGVPPAGGGRLTRRFEFRLPDSALEAVPPTTLGSAKFPPDACRRRTSGRVALEVDTDATGAVQRARIHSSEPKTLFDAAALAVARGSRLSPAYRDGRPTAATALLTLYFDPSQANCPGSQVPDLKRPAQGKPQPRVTQNDERTAIRAGP